MEIEKILSKFYGSEAKRVAYARWLEIVEEKLKQDGRTIEAAVQDEAFVISLFTAKDRDTAKVSSPQYFLIKSYLLALYEACAVKGVVPARLEINRGAVADAYFVDLQAIIAFIDKVGNYYLLNYSKEKDLLTAKSIVILGWHGISYSQMPSLKKTDLIATENNRYYIRLKESQIEISKQEYEILFANSKQLSYRGLPEGKLQDINDNYFGLIIPPVKEIGSDSQYIKQYFKRFCKCCSDAFNRKIYFNNLHTNKMFTVLYEKKIKYNDLIDKIAELTEISPNSCYYLREDYCIWLNNYYPNYFDTLGSQT